MEALCGARDGQPGEDGTGRLDAVLGASALVFPGIGSGADCRLRGEGVAGAALVVRGRVGHLVAFPMLSAHVLAQYAVVILPALVVAEQLGLPLPAVPALVAIGALAASGEVSVPQVLGVLAVAALVVDLGSYELGRRRGARALALVGRLSAEPDAWLRRAGGLFQRYGVWAVLVAKFLPGVTALMPPLAGALGMRRGRFVALEIAGVLVWAGVWLGLGWSGYRLST